MDMFVPPNETIMLHQIFRLFYPNICTCCDLSLIKSEQHICTSCILGLPYTHYQYEPGNALEKVFWGRCNVRNGVAFLHYRKGGSVQRILHEIKYKNNWELAEYIGLLYGSELSLFADKEHIDAVVSVPLHPDKLVARGYNQSAFFARGLSRRLGIPDLSAGVIRLKNTATQTRKSRIERWENVSQIFEVLHPELYQNKHILLVDDVITTGATMESLVMAFQSIPGCKVSVGGIAYASHS